MMAKRKPEELSVVATGVQNLEARFGKRRRLDNDDLPPIAPWRCNLTGLSQEQNLYFVAYGRDIYVYVPQFPSQSVDRPPALIVPSQPSNPSLRGYIDRREPHTINNLVVQHLGNDEVVATVRDDGDVDVVLVRHIVQAIEIRAEPESAISGLADEVKPIFQSNVGISAWGLAIHTAGRILAVSSNAHEVRVYKFGLAHDEEDFPWRGPLGSDAFAGEGSVLTDVGNDREHKVQQSLDETQPREEKRRMDVTETVLNGNANIPHISFCNTGDDPEARWLLTTDIEGYCRFMDLQADRGADVTVRKCSYGSRSRGSSSSSAHHERTHTDFDVVTQLQSFRFGRSIPSSIAGMDRHNAGWAIMFLDPRSFLSESNFTAALGLQEGQRLPGWQAGKTTWDLSDTVEQLPENSEAFVYDQPRQRRQRPRQVEQRSVEGSQLISPGDTSTTSEASLDRSSSYDAIDDDAVSDLVNELAERDEDMGFVSEDESDLSSEDEHDQSIDDNENQDEYLEDEEVSFDGHIALIHDDQDFDDEGTQDNIPFSSMYGGRRIFGNQPIFSPPGGLAHKWPCPIFHASVRNIYLLQPSQGAPMVGLANPLRQSVQSGLEFLNHFERLNMSAYIPQVGVLVLASQKGRALVLSLIKLKKSAQYPIEMQETRPKRTCYAMRVERILPLANQEKAGQRPFAPLHGIAASPLQGAGQRRWRLMMMYQDHSILSYEISRKQSRDSAIAFDSVVV